MGYVGRHRFLGGEGAISVAGARLIPAGHFSNLTPPVVSSLPNTTILSTTTSFSSHRPTPAKYQTLNLSNKFVSANDSNLGAIYIWCDVLQATDGATLNVDGELGGQGDTQCSTESRGGVGGRGGAGGGGGGAAQGVCSSATGGSGGDVSLLVDTSGNTGDFFTVCGEPVVPGYGGGGFAYAAGGGYLDLDNVSPVAYLMGGTAGGGGGLAGLGFGAGGNGGDALGPSCFSSFSAGGGGGGGASSLVVVTREMILSAGTILFAARGGDGGFSSGGSGGGTGGGGGSVQLYINKISTASLTHLSVAVGGGIGGEGAANGNAGNYKIYEISNTGTILTTYTNTLPTIGWDHT